MKLNSNIKDTALILEGGGMRASYTAGIVTVLLEQQLYFNFLAGISAGSSVGVNYMARDIARTRKCFVDIVSDPKIGGLRSLLKGAGYFNSNYIYGKICEEGQLLELDYQAFQDNEATFMVGAFNARTGKLQYFSNQDMVPNENLTTIIRASSSMPFLMPITKFKDELFYDGGLTGGIPLDIAKKQGYQKFFIILTRPKGYRKAPLKQSFFWRLALRRYPKVFDAMLRRAENYNQTITEIERLEKNGQAFVVYPENLTVKNTELDLAKLKSNFNSGYNQASRDLAQYKEFVGI